MRFSIFTKEDKVSLELKKRLLKSLKSYIYDELNPQLVITIGGDGTVLRAVGKYIASLDKIYFFTINTGNLGFFTNFLPEEEEVLLNKIINYAKMPLESFSLLEYKINAKESFSGYALNEVTISNPPRVSFLDVFIDNEHFESFKGTGLLIATSVGSTAYSKSLGGAIIDPSINALELTEISSINSNAYKTLGSSLIVCGSKKIILKPIKETAFLFTADYTSKIIEELKTLEVDLSEKKVTFIKNSTNNFFERIKRAFL